MENVSVRLTKKELVILTHSLVEHITNIKDMDCEECYFVDCNSKKEYVKIGDALLHDLIEISGRE